MAYQSVLFVSSADQVGDAQALAHLCGTFGEARDTLQLLYVGEHHVTGFGATIAHGHIANDMQIRQEIFPQLKLICDRSGIPPGRINTRLGDRIQAIERFIGEYNIELLALAGSFVAAYPGTVRELIQLLGQRHCELYVVS